MKKIALISVVAMLWSYLSTAQQPPYSGPPYDENKVYINSRIEDLSLGRMFNYATPEAKLSDFGDKVVILSFWFTTCGTCIALFPVEDSLQKVFSDDIQIIPVTFERPDIAINFLQAWQARNGRKLALPFIVGDTLLTGLFPNSYFPHYVWIGEDRRIIAHTSEHFLTEENIKAILIAIGRDKDHLKTATGAITPEPHRVSETITNSTY